MKRLLLSIGVAAATALGGQAAAQPVESEGEESTLQTCFYECKPGPVVRGIPTWQEVTTLMLVNLNPGNASSRRFGTLVILDGRANFIAGVPYDVGPLDFDEVNVCRTLEAAGIPAPQAGVIHVISDNLAFGATPYVWMKNLLGKFFTNVNEPFAGRVTGIAKTECRLVPVKVGGSGIPLIISSQFDSSGAPTIDPILVEGTSDPFTPVPLP